MKKIVNMKKIFSILAFLLFTLPLISAQVNTTILNITGDTTLQSWSPNRNYGGFGSIWVFYAWWGEYKQYGLVKGNLSSLPEDITIVNAEFVYYSLSSGFSAKAHDVYQDWNEGTVTWNTMPNFNSTPFVVWAHPSYHNRAYVNVTDYVQDHYESDKLANFLVQMDGRSGSKIEWGSKENYYPSRRPYLNISYVSAVVEEVKVNTSLITPSDFYMEEDNVIYLDVNSTGSPADVNITYDNTNAFVDYCDDSGCYNITGQLPYKKTYANFSDYMQVNFTVYPIDEVWDGYTATVEYDGSTDTYDYHVPNITRSYRYPLYSYEFTYPTKMYILENSTQTLEATPNENYTYAKPNVTVRYDNENALVYYKDNLGFSANITDQIPYEKTYTELWQLLEVNITVYPLNQNYIGYEVKSAYESVTVPETTLTFNKSEEFPESDPDYVEVNYRYTPVEYPLENKTLMLQFHHFIGNWEDTFYLCQNETIEGRTPIYENETEGVYCYAPTVNLTIECRNCNTTSEKQLVQYWSNETDCDYLLGGDGLLSYRLNYWNYPVDMILLDSDYCGNWTGVVNVTGFVSKGSLTSMDNRDKYVFFNGTDEKYNDRMVESADSIGTEVVWDQGTGQTTVRDKDKNKKGESAKVYTVETVLSDNEAIFYIANTHKNTVWLDEIRIPNTLKYEYIQSLEAFYTSHNGKTIDLLATYDLEIDELVITPANTNEKIPIEPATGSNVLTIFGNPSPTGTVVGLIYIVVALGMVVFTVKNALSGDLSVEKMIAILLVIVIGIALLGVLVMI